MKIQKLLNAAGCNAGIADGIWGRRTQEAAVAFAKKAKFPTTKATFFSKQYLNALQNAPNGYCPKRSISRTVKREATLGGSWYLKTTCDGGQNFTGKADLKLQIKPTQKGKESYTIQYKNNLNQRASGQGKLDKAILKVVLYFEGFVEPVKATLLINNNNLLKGSDNNNCSITATRM